MFIVFATVFFLSSTAHADNQDVTLKDLQTITRTIGFLEEKSSAPLNMAIVYDPNINISVRNARRMRDLIKSQDNKQITPLLVPVSELSLLKEASFAFVTTGLQPHYNEITSALNTHRILSFTLDRACLEQNCCAIYVNSENRVEIVINKTITDTLNARFKPIFLMLVTVI
ncbi:MAG: hypothetical protein ACQEQL_00175 [Pseudomonadota bacterium]